MMQRKRMVQKNHIAGLDGLRGIATIAVVLYHMFPQQVKGGFLGVSLFFVLSGYLMAVKSEEMADFNTLFFFRRRILKIYPALIVVVCLTVIVLGILIRIPLNNIQGEILSIVGGYNNWWQISQNTSYFTKVNGTSGLIHLWSLAVEMQFYIIWPVLLWSYKMISVKIGKKTGVQIILLLAFLSLTFSFLLYGVGEDATRIYYGTDTRIYALLFGSALGFMHVDSQQKRKEKAGILSRAAFIICMAAVLILFFCADGQSTLTYLFYLPVACFLFLILVFLSADPGFVYGYLLDAKPFSWLGEYSYEIYLCQYPITFIFKVLNKGKYTLGQVVFEILMVITISWILHNSLVIGQRRKEQKKWIHIVIVSVPLLIGMGFILSLGGFVESVDQKGLKEELQANANLLNEQDDTNESYVGDEFENVENYEHLQEPESEMDILFIGDSVMLGARSKLQNTIDDCRVEAAESRQVWDATEIINKLKEEGNLGKCVVIGLGSNGSFDEWRGQELIDAIGDDKKIYWISAYGEYMTWQESVNDMIYRLADANENVTVIDWAGFAQGHSEWFYNDGMHLNDDGQVAYSEFLKENIFTFEE